MRNEAYFGACALLVFQEAVLHDGPEQQVWIVGIFRAAEVGGGIRPSLRHRDIIGCVHEI
ncbi:hypothetical protein D3C71_1798180 [compost metagenome]